jgi:hypothetical protein
MLTHSGDWRSTRLQRAGRSERGGRHCSIRATIAPFLTG